MKKIIEFYKKEFRWKWFLHAGPEFILAVAFFFIASKFRDLQPWFMQLGLDLKYWFGAEVAALGVAGAMNMIFVDDREDRLPASAKWVPVGMITWYLILLFIKFWKMTLLMMVARLSSHGFERGIKIDEIFVRFWKAVIAILFLFFVIGGVANYEPASNNTLFKEMSDYKTYKSLMYGGYYFIFMGFVEALLQPIYQKLRESIT